ncbi:MAG: rhomboid family intramembrane serine protease [Thermoanaerobaculia bacterium]
MIPIRDDVPSRQLPIANWLIIGANIAVFVHEVLLPAPRLESFIESWAFVPAPLTGPGPAVAPLATSMFLHGGFFHLAANLWVLWIFGDNVEDRMGPIGYILFYLLCGLAAGLVHWASAPASTIPTVGASGAISGVMGAYFLLYPRARVVLLVPLLFWPVFVEVPALVFLAVWFLGQLWSGASAGLAAVQEAGIAWWAHVGGFVAGMVLVWLFARRPAPPGRRRRRRVLAYRG